MIPNKQVVHGLNVIPLEKDHHVEYGVSRCALGAVSPGITGRSALNTMVLMTFFQMKKVKTHQLLIQEQHRDARGDVVLVKKQVTNRHLVHHVHSMTI